MLQVISVRVLTFLNSIPHLGILRVYNCNPGASLQFYCMSTFIMTSFVSPELQLEYIVNILL